MPSQAKKKPDNGTATAREDTALSTREEHGRELSVVKQAAIAQHEIQSAISVAVRFPRNEQDAFGRLMMACRRLSFAYRSMYSFPRGGNTITGPSSHLAREAARVWGNIQYGFEIIGDDGEHVHLRGWAWDMQTNSKAAQDAHFRKLVQRKVGGKTAWVVPDERDLRELTNKHGAIAERNCILKIIPTDLIYEALTQSEETIEAGVSQDLDGERKKIIKAFAELNVAVGELEGYLGNPLKHATPKQVALLRTIYKSILDGNTRWLDYQREETKDAPKGIKREATVDDLLSPQALSTDPASVVAGIIEAIEEAAAAGDADKVEKIYDATCGPDANLSTTQTSVVEQTVKRVRAELAVDDSSGQSQQEIAY